jgi:hypothetical protein
MSDDHEERIREDWYYTYKAWDAADDKRSLERQNEITRLGAEGARLEREIERSERARELQEWIGGKAQARHSNSRGSALARVYAGEALQTL